MPKIRKCIICGQEFLSRNGRYTCSDVCQLKRKREEDRASNYRRYHKESNAPIIKTCPVCGKKFNGLRRTYCFDECSKIARKRIVNENSRLDYELRKKGNN